MKGQPIMPIHEAIRQSIKLGVEVLIKNENGKVRITGLNKDAGESHTTIISYGIYLNNRISAAIVTNFGYWFLDN